MEKGLNIAAILKDKPKGTKLYTDAFGELSIEDIFAEDELGINLSTNDGDDLYFYNDGKYNVHGEPILFPSKEMRDWSKFSWKKGDVLVMDGYRVVFDKWLNDDYTRFNAVHLITSDGGYIDKPLQNRYSPISNFITRNWRKMTDAETKIYMDSLERECGGKLNRETLEIEKQPEFKDGDVMFVRCEDEGFIEIFKYSKKNGDLYDHASLTTRTQALDISGKYKIHKDEIVEIRLATEEEKKQLFSALEKEGKAWDAEKKRIVELKPKIELKPFDKVLIRDFKDQAWQVSLFGYKDANNYYCCNGSCWNQCIPYIGNESLLGTTKDVEG